MKSTRALLMLLAVLALGTVTVAVAVRAAEDGQRLQYTDATFPDCQAGPAPCIQRGGADVWEFYQTEETEPIQIKSCPVVITYPCHKTSQNDVHTLSGLTEDEVRGGKK